MPSSMHYVYRELQAIIAKNRKAIGAPCDFSQSRWVCGMKDGGVKERPLHERVFAMTTLSDNLPPELLDHNYASTEEPPEIIEIGRKTAPLNVKKCTTPVSAQSASIEDDGQWMGKSSTLLRRKYDAMSCSPAQNITSERNQSRSPARQQRNRSSKRSNGGQHKLDGFLRKKPQDENSTISRKRMSIQEQLITVTKPFPASANYEPWQQFF